MPLGIEVGLSPDDFVFNGDPATPRIKGTPHPTQFLAHVYCGQTARWIKMPLVTEVNLGPGDVVLDGVAAPSKRGTAPPVFHSCLLWPNGSMDQDATWYGGRRRSKRHCVRWGTQLTLKRGTAPPPASFWPMPVVAKRLGGSRCHLVRR